MATVVITGSTQGICDSFSKSQGHDCILGLVVVVVVALNFGIFVYGWHSLGTGLG